MALVCHPRRFRVGTVGNWVLPILQEEKGTNVVVGLA